ncbi:DUF4241 domain-containing protein [Riemerella columbina]|uniref:DUF4241 domain-containing protein n=1 Tax=Riemerella columbina TaxID=103810 RepID=UPI00266F9F73|nr:DUF4241 domain-containing protein [Riemerella columbina]WKS95563.1 DUF4241 domain-containing protein [Riemerella columbina]
MNPIQNIAKLFSKGFVEHPLIESYDAGHLHLSTGQMVACDPLITNDMLPFETPFPKGDFPITVHREKDSHCIAYVEVAFSRNPTTQWQMATTAGQDPKTLVGEEIFGYPVQSGMGCLMDLETQTDLNALEQSLFQQKGDDFMGLYEEFFHHHFFDEKGAIDQYALLTPNEAKKNNIFAFETGYGEGFYASYIGYDATGAPTQLITEFIEIKID